MTHKTSLCRTPNPPQSRTVHDILFDKRFINQQVSLYIYIHTLLLSSNDCTIESFNLFGWVIFLYCVTKLNAVVWCNACFSNRSRNVNFIFTLFSSSYRIVILNRRWDDQNSTNNDNTLSIQLYFNTFTKTRV